MQQRAKLISLCLQLLSIVCMHTIWAEEHVMKPTIVITGGAGYIGSHAAYLMAQKGYHVIIIDKLVHGQTWPHTWASCIQADYADTDVLSSIFTKHSVEAVMHFAAYTEVGESVKDPLRFYENNVSKTITLLQCMLAHNIKKFIFSSSCAVYGTPQLLPLTEDHTCNPISPYGSTKHMIEQILADCQRAYGLEYVCLRYFNAAGALAELGLGERHEPETHLIPLIFKAAFEHAPFKIFGTDHMTPDGTCIRDFLHVWDIAQAHWLALEHLNSQHPSDTFNLGTGTGFSVKHVLIAAQELCGPVTTLYMQKREGDPAILVADASRARDILGWQPRHSSLEFILKSAYAFAREHMHHSRKADKTTPLHV